VHVFVHVFRFYVDLFCICMNELLSSHFEKYCLYLCIAIHVYKLPNIKFQILHKYKVMYYLQLFGKLLFFVVESYR